MTSYPSNWYIHSFVWIALFLTPAIFPSQDEDITFFGPVWKRTTLPRGDASFRTYLEIQDCSYHPSNEAASTSLLP
jgi:hypothetical protein